MLMKRLLLLPLLTLLAGVSFSQIDYQIRIDELYSAADDSDGSGDEDPVWKFYLTDDDSGPTNASGCISVTKSYDSWWTGTPLEGPAIPHSWFTRTNCNATMFSTQFEAWEDDACGLTCDFDDNCVFNDDDGHAPVGTSNGTAANTQDINFLTGAPCTYNQYTICLLYTSPSPRDRQKSRMPSSA